MIWAIEQKFCFVKVTLNKKMGSVYKREWRVWKRVWKR